MTDLGIAKDATQAAGLAGLSGAVPPGIDRTVSVYLDLLRLCAALAVFLQHAHNFLLHDIDAPVLFSHGNEAVAVFFVLSGFVIRMVTVTRETDWCGYAAARIARVMPVAVLALAVTALADWHGLEIAVAHYAMLDGLYDFFMPESFASLWGSLTFSGDFGFRHIIFGSNEPYWSLGFEVWYYVLWGLVVFVPVRWRGFAIAGWMLLCGPRIVLFSLLWLAGAAVHKIASRPVKIMQPRMGRAVLIGTFAGYLLVRRVLGPHAGMMYGFYMPEREALTFLYYGSIAALAGLNILAFDAAFGGRQLFGPQAAQWIKLGAGASFTLYLVHQPLLLLVSAVVPPGIVNGLGGCAFVLGAAWALAELAERRKVFFLRLVRRVV